MLKSSRTRNLLACGLVLSALAFAVWWSRGSRAGRDSLDSLEPLAGQEARSAPGRALASSEPAAVTALAAEVEAPQQDSARRDEPRQPRAERIRLRIVDELSGLPLAETALELTLSDPWRDEGSARPVVTDAQGRLELELGAEGTYYLLPETSLQQGSAPSWIRFHPDHVRASEAGETTVSIRRPALHLRVWTRGPGGERLASSGLATHPTGSFEPEADASRRFWFEAESRRWVTLGRFQQLPGATLLAFFEEELYEPFWLLPRLPGLRKGTYREALLVGEQRGFLEHIFETVPAANVGVRILEHDGSPARNVVLRLVDPTGSHQLVRGRENVMWGHEDVIDWGFLAVPVGSWTLVVMDEGSREELARQSVLVRPPAPESPVPAKGSERLEIDVRNRFGRSLSDQDVLVQLPARRGKSGVSGQVRDQDGRLLQGVALSCVFASGGRLSLRSDKNGAFAFDFRATEQLVRVFPGGEPWEGRWRPMVREVPAGSDDLVFTRLSADTARVEFRFVAAGAERARRGPRHVVVYREVPGGGERVGDELLSCDDSDETVSCPVTPGPELRYVARVPGFRSLRGTIPAPAQRGERVRIEPLLERGFADSFTCLDSESGAPLAGVRVLGEGGALLATSGRFGALELEAARWPYELVFERPGYRTLRLRLDWDGLSEHWEGRLRLSRAR